MKKLLFISLAVVLALSMALVGCGGTGGFEYDLTITSSSGGTTFPAPGTHTYAQGQVVDIQATPASDAYEFVNWTGADADQIEDVNAAETTITVNGDYSIQANFQSIPWDYTIPLTFHGTISETASICEYVFKPWIEELEGLTGSQGGKFSVTQSYGDAPFDASASLSAISGGSVDMGQLSGDTFHLGGVSYLPFHFADMETFAYVTYNLFTENNGKWDEAGELDGVKILVTAPLWGGQWWGKVPAHVPADLEGVKIRVEGNEGDAVLALGGIPVELGTSDIGGALQTGIVQGCFFTWTGFVGFTGIGPNTDYVTELDIYYRAYSLAMNRDVYEGLPEEAKDAIDSICGATKSMELAAAHDASQGGLRGATIGNKDVYIPTEADLVLWHEATADVPNDWAAYLDSIQYDGSGILDRIEQLIAATPAH